MSAPVYTDATFRAQFPAFADQNCYPPAALEFAWNMGANWVSQTQACWGVGSRVASRLQQAADLMGAVIAVQLYARSKGGGTAGPLVSASDEGTSATYQLPAFGSSAFSSMLLSYPPYGPMLLSLLQVSASVGPYIGSRRPSWVPP